MGWSWEHKSRGIKVTDLIRDNLTWESDTSKNTCLDVALVRLRTAYAAVERIDKATGEREVWAAVFLLGYAPNDYYNFGYKDMSESMGPCEAECPERILKQLTPTDSEWANQWREKCWENLKKRKAVNALLKVGGRYKLTRTVAFVDGAELDDVVVERLKGQYVTVTRPGGWGRYRLPRYYFSGAERVA